MKYKISGVKVTGKEKAATFGYKPFKTKSPEKFMDYLNTHATVIASLKKGHRSNDNIECIHNWVRVDCDEKGEHSKVSKKLNKMKVEYFKVPSTNNHKKSEKWHFFIRVDEVSQDLRAYKKQVEHFYKELGVPLKDTSARLPSLNFNPYRNGKYAEEAKQISVFKKGKALKLANAKVIENQIKKDDEQRLKDLEDKKSDTSVKEVKEKLSTLNPDMKEPQWMTVARSLHTWNPKKGFKLFKKWSKGGENYQKGVCETKWEHLEKTNKGEQGIGTLMKMRPNGTIYEEEHFKPLTEKQLKKIKKQAVKREVKKQMEAEVHKKYLNENTEFVNVDFGMNDEKVKDMKSQKHLYQGMVVEGLHSVLYGAAGTNKTTVMGWMTVKMLLDNPEKYVHFWSFDAQQSHNLAMYNYAKEMGVSDRMKIINDQTAADWEKHYQKAITADADLSSLIIVNDTLKFITDDVNSKTAMKKTMHFIKEVCQLGASTITLSHANKDGLKQSGTAELEQDGDALFRIERDTNKDTGEVTVSIRSSGRCRFNTKDFSLVSKPDGDDYEYLYSSMTTMKRSDEFVDIVEKHDEENVSKKPTEKERLAMKEIKRIIKDLSKGKKNNAWHNTIEIEARRQEKLSPSIVASVLRKFDGNKWTYKLKKKKGTKTREKLYNLIK